MHRYLVFIVEEHINSFLKDKNKDIEDEMAADDI